MTRFPRYSFRLTVASLATTVLLSSLPLLNTTLLGNTASANPPARLPANVTLLETDHDIQVYRLPSGQTLFIKEVHDQPIVTIDTWVKTGSVNEVAANNGVSHFLEHLIFKGTKQYQAGEIDHILESRGASFNAATSDDFTHYYITTASQFFDEALRLHADMLINATVPQQELDKERKVVQEEINRAVDNPDHKRFQALSQLIYGSHPYALDTLGPKALIGTIPRADIIRYYNTWYQPKNLNTVIVGDVNPKQVIEWVQQYFVPTPQKVALGVPLVKGPEPLKKSAVKVLEDEAVTQDYLTLGFLAPSIEQRDDMAALDVAMLILGNGKSSRLHQELVENQALATSIGAGNLTQKYSGLLYIDAQMKPENRQKVKDEILNQLQQLLQKGVTEEELNKAKTQTIKDHTFHTESTEDVANRIGNSVTIGKLSDYTGYVDAINRVTAEDVQRVLKTYLDFNKVALVELLPKGTASLVDLTAENQKLVDMGSAAQEMSLADSMKAVVENCDVTDSVSKSCPSKEILSNGMTLVMKPRKDTNTVAIKIFVRGGQGVEPIPGVSSLVSALLMKSTQTRSAEEINQELESQGIGLSIVPHEDYIEVSGSSVTGDLGELFQVLQDVLNFPQFDPAEIKKEKELLKQSIQAAQDSPTSVAFENLATNLYPSHPYGNVGRRVASHLDLIDRDLLLNYYQGYFSPCNMVVSAVGNFEPERLKAYLTQLSTGMKHAHLLTRTPLVTPLDKPVTVDEKKPIQGATWIAQGWLTPPVADQDYAPLKVLNAILGGGMSSRLFEDLRKKQGLAYAVGSFYPTAGKQSKFVMYIGTDPKNQAQILKGFDEEIKRLQAEAVTDKELQDAKDKVTGAFLLSHETNSEQAFYLGLYETLGTGYQFDEQYPKLVQKVRVEDIQRVAQKYFKAPSVISIVSPKAVEAPAKPAESAQ